MRNLLVVCSAILLSACALAPNSFGQQDKSQRPSPPAQAVFHFADGKTVTVDYSSPRAKGRKIFGGCPKLVIPPGRNTLLNPVESNAWVSILPRLAGTTTL